MRSRPRSRILVLGAAAFAILLLGSCTGTQQAAAPATHQMVGTNSPGY